MTKLNTLKSIFNELLKGNISVLSMEAREFLAKISIELNELNNYESENVEELKYLIMICNVLYNRTDMLVLPVEDGVYDLLLERYKTFDPNFQVGSAVVQFTDKVEKECAEAGVKINVKPVIFLNEKKDDARKYFEEKLTEFDKTDLLTPEEAFYKCPVRFENNTISKRTHNTKHNHPDLVGTLDKCKFVLNQEAIDKGVFDDPDVQILERDFFGKHIKEGIISPKQKLELVVELKYDGVSVEADCDTIVESARTRGDTGIGEAADITPILHGYRFFRNNILSDQQIGVKFEAIMTKTDLQRFNDARGYTYANCRTAIVGLFGASDAAQFRDYITLIPLALDRDQVPVLHNRMEEIEMLNSEFRTHGQALRYVYINGDYQECLYAIKKFAEEAVDARSYLDFMFDGIVVSYLDEGIRHKLGRKNFINKYSMAVKFNPVEKLTMFMGYTFEVGQTGTIIPMIHYNPVEFFGTIHPKSSGHSYKRFKELGLRYGDIVRVVYTHDVMPYVYKYDCEANKNNTSPVIEFPTTCPICGTQLVISASGNSASCPNPNCKGRVLTRTVSMLQKMNIKGFAESTILSLKTFTFTDLFNLREEEIAKVIGPTTAKNLITAIKDAMEKPTPDCQLIGALGFTRMASEKWQLVFSIYTLKEFVDKMNTNPEEVRETIRNIKGLGKVSADTIVEEYPIYKNDIITILENANIVDSKSIVTKKQIRFTGCRNKQLEELLCKQGYDADGDKSVTKNTDILVVPYMSFKSNKTSKIGPNTKVVLMSDLMADANKYLK